MCVRVQDAFVLVPIGKYVSPTLHMHGPLHPLWCFCVSFFFNLYPTICIYLAPFDSTMHER